MAITVEDLTKQLASVTEQKSQLIAQVNAVIGVENFIRSQIAQLEEESKETVSDKVKSLFKKK